VFIVPETTLDHHADDPLPQSLATIEAVGSFPTYNSMASAAGFQ
jgi:hypothetical protein